MIFVPDSAGGAASALRLPRARKVHRLAKRQQQKPRSRQRQQQRPEEQMDDDDFR